MKSVGVEIEYSNDLCVHVAYKIGNVSSIDDANKRIDELVINPLIDMSDKCAEVNFLVEIRENGICFCEKMPEII